MKRDPLYNAEAPDQHATTGQPCAAARDVSRSRNDETRRAGRIGSGASDAMRMGAFAVGAFAVGAMAVGAMAIGALAIGRLAVKRLSVKRSRINRLEIDELVVRRFQVEEVLVTSRYVTPDDNVHNT